MSIAVKTTVTSSGDRLMFETASKALRTPKKLMHRIGVLGMSSATRRLSTVLSSDDDAIRTGRLGASLALTGSPDTVFDLDELSVEFGTNVPYGAQVHFGGTIVPRNAKALAIPLVPQLKRDGIGPRELDPTGELLRFQPITGSKPNVFAVLINDEAELTGRQRKPRGVLSGLPPGPLFALAYWVTQQPKPFLLFDEEDLRTIREDLMPQWIKGQ